MKLNELMTSDFNGGYTPNELVNFLIDFRTNYRVIHHKNIQLQRIIDKKDMEIDELKKEKEQMKKRNDILMKYVNRVNKKLTWGERISGKIKNVNYGTK